MAAISFGSNEAITQKIYVNDILKRLGTQDCESAHTTGYRSTLSDELHAAITSELQDFNMHGRSIRHVDEYSREIGEYKG